MRSMGKTVQTSAIWLWAMKIASANGLQAQNQSKSQSSTEKPYATCSNPIFASLDVDGLKATICAGQVYQQRNFLSELQVSSLLQEVKELEDAGEFVRFGLSNTAERGNQQFGESDRSTCIVPWWMDFIHGNELPITNIVGPSLHHLRQTLAEIFDRPTLLDSSLAHECYFSTSGVGSFLPRHMDERHEELKGPKGWIQPSRRSFTWLIYLSDDNWTLEENGGALRAYPQQKVLRSHNLGSAHNENLQIGWLQSKNGSQPVYMDSWFTLAGDSEPHCVLYKVFDKQRVVLTKPWKTTAILQGISVPEFLQEWAIKDSNGIGKPVLFLHEQDAKQFNLLEDRRNWNSGKDPQGSFPFDVSPERALLLIFDSLLVPHQVEAVRKGRRVALAGWFHEATQPIPASLYVAQ